jgi:hypothetical protein
VEKVAVQVDMFNTQQRNFENFGHAILPSGEGMVTSATNKVDLGSNTEGISSKAAKRARKEA